MIRRQSAPPKMAAEREERLKTYWARVAAAEEAERRAKRMAATERSAINKAKREAPYFLRLLSGLRGDDMPAVAKALGLPLSDVRRAMNKTRKDTQIDLGEDMEFWQKFLAAVDEAIGGLMGIREEAQRKIAEERRSRLMERQRIQQ